MSASDQTWEPPLGCTDEDDTADIRALYAESTAPLIRIEIVDGHQLLAQALASFLAQEGDISVIAVRRELDTVAIRRTQPDVLILGYLAMLTYGEVPLASLRADLPNLKLLILTATLDEDTLATCVRLGGAGCITQDRRPIDLLRAIRMVHQGNVLFAPELLVRLLRTNDRRPSPIEQPTVHLAPREREILIDLAQGLTTAEVAAHLVVSPHTVRTQVKSAMSKLNARSRSAAIAIAIRQRLIDPPDNST